MAKLAEAKTTRTLPILWTMAAMIGVNHPMPLARTAKALNTRPNTILTLIMFNILRERRINQGSLEILSCVSAISAVSRATSVPAAPMATPTCETASAGASLIPSPTNIAGRF